jgi:hypothetical protein
MNARQSLVLGSEQLRLFRTVLDETWEAVKAHCPANAQSIEVRRLRVANAVIAAWRDGATDFKAASVKLMTCRGKRA